MLELVRAPNSSLRTCVPVAAENFLAVLREHRSGLRYFAKSLSSGWYRREREGTGSSSQG